VKKGKSHLKFVSDTALIQGPQTSAFRRFGIFLALLAWSNGALGQQHPMQPGIDVLHYDFSLTLPDAGASIEGIALITVCRSQPADHLVLDLIDLRVDSVFVNQRTVKFSRTPVTLDIPLPEATGTAPDTLLVAVRYAGEVKDGLIIHADKKGRWFAFGDNWPARAHCWLPTVDRPDDKATVAWTINAPSDRKVIANGALIEENQVGAPSAHRTITHWSTERPIPPYLMVIAVGPLIGYDLGLTAHGMSEFPPGVNQSVYAVPELADYLPGPFKYAGDIVEFFAHLVGPFPYEKLAHLQSYTRFGGMENASAIFYANDLFERRSNGTGIIAHETAHQWFGDAVTPRTWGHLWLSEGFASYFEQLWVERSEGSGALRQGMSNLRREILASSTTQKRPVIDTLQTDPMRLLNTNSYQKGAWTLHMLRSLIGNSAFFAGIQSYYDHHKHSTATSDDLCAEFEHASNTSLRWYFDQWLRRPGFPDLSLGWTYDDVHRSVKVDIKQGSRFSPYRFPLKIETRTSDGHLHTVTIEVPALESVSIQLPSTFNSRPTRLVFDPDVELLANIISK